MIWRRRPHRDGNTVFVFIHSARHPVVLPFVIGTTWVAGATLRGSILAPTSIREELSPLAQSMWSGTALAGCLLLLFAAGIERRRPHAAVVSTMIGAGLTASGFFTYVAALLSKFNFEYAGSTILWASSLGIGYAAWSAFILIAEIRERGRCRDGRADEAVDSGG